MRGTCSDPGPLRPSRTLDISLAVGHRSESSLGEVNVKENPDGEEQDSAERDLQPVIGWLST